MSGQLHAPMQMRAELEAELRNVAAMAGAAEARIRDARRSRVDASEARVAYTEALGAATRIIRTIMDSETVRGQCSFCAAGPRVTK